MRKPRECESDNGGDEKGDWELGRIIQFEREEDQLSLKVVCVGLQGAQPHKRKELFKSVAQVSHKLYNVQRTLYCTSTQIRRHAKAKYAQYGDNGVHKSEKRKTKKQISNHDLRRGSQYLLYLPRKQVRSTELNPDRLGCRTT